MTLPIRMIPHCPENLTWHGIRPSSI